MASQASAGRLLEARNLAIDFPMRRGIFGQAVSRVRAVDGVTLSLSQSETLGLVGESGSGKTTLGRLILGLLTPDEGTIAIDGCDVRRWRGRDRMRLCRDVQVVYQDPASAMNPRMTVREIVEEPLAIHRLGHHRERAKRVDQLLDRVGLAHAHGDRYPHELSGGQKQRVCIARAIATDPRLVICDEAVSALDVSVQAQILNLLVDLQRDTGVALVFISHNLAVVRQISHRVAVLYLGRVVETADAANLFAGARHPYTLALMAAVPRPVPGVDNSPPPRIAEPSSVLAPPGGCRFHPRCPIATDLCRRVEPMLETKAGLADSHLVACHHAETPITIEGLARSAPTGLAPR